MLSLSEVERITGLSKSKIDKYERAGLLEKPSEHLFEKLYYDDEHITRLWILRFYNELGYTIPQIQQQIKDGIDIDLIINELTAKREKLDRLIEMAGLIKETEGDIESVYSLIKEAYGIGNAPNEIITFDVLYHILSLEYQNIMAIEEYSKEIEEMFDALSDRFVESLDIIFNLWEEGITPEDKRIVEEVRKSFDDYKSHIMNSVVGFCVIMKAIFNNNEAKVELVEDYAQEFIRFWTAAIDNFANEYKDYYPDTFEQCVDRLINLAINKYTTRSPEVQKELTNIFNATHYPYDAKITIAKNVKTVLVKPEIIDEFDGGNKRGVAWFISRCIDIFLENIDNNPDVIRG